MFTKLWYMHQFNQYSKLVLIIFTIYVFNVFLLLLKQYFYLKKPILFESTYTQYHHIQKSLKYLL